jgi:imidazolonepropionase-like amidohydrolase
VRRASLLLSTLGVLTATLLSRGLRAEGPKPVPPPIAITHGKVYLPGGKPPIDDGTVVIDRGKIVSVGKDVTAPPGATTIDAHGKIVTPGFIDAVTAVGVVDVDLEAASNDTDNRGLMTPALRMVDGYNPRSTIIPITRSGGITSVVVAPDHGVLGGQSTFADLAGDEESEAIVRPVLAQNAFLDDGMAQWSSGSRGGMWLTLREALEDARFYGTHKAQYDANGSRPLSLSRAGLEALQPVLKGDQIVVVEAHRASDIEAALRLADEVKIKIVLSGASEAWMLADELARRKMPVIINPLENLPARFDRLHARSDNAAILSRAGVPVIIATYAAHQSRLLWQHAGNAVRMGMDHDDAIRAVTENPAAAFGLKGYGRLEAGAVANVVVWSGDPLQIGSKPEHVLVHGREQSLETRQTLLLDRYRSLPVPRDGSR